MDVRQRRIRLLSPLATLTEFTEENSQEKKRESLSAGFTRNPKPVLNPFLSDRGLQIPPTNNSVVPPIHFMAPIWPSTNALEPLSLPPLLLPLSLISRSRARFMASIHPSIHPSIHTPIGRATTATATSASRVRAASATRCGRGPTASRPRGATTTSTRFVRWPPFAFSCFLDVYSSMTKFSASVALLQVLFASSVVWLFLSSLWGGRSGCAPSAAIWLSLSRRWSD